jgi:hypothetical protein
MIWPFRRATPPSAPSVIDLLLAQREIADLRAENMRLLATTRQQEMQIMALQARLAPFVKVRARDARGHFLA